MQPASLIIPLLLLVLSVCCGEDQANIVADKQCTEGVLWVGQEGDRRSYSDVQLWDMDHVGAPEMTPGRDCVACHAADEGPGYIIAGTVFRKLNEPSDCAGVYGATVIIKDAAKREYRLEANPMGNFYLKAKDAPEFKKPFEAKLLFGGIERQMFTAQTNGSCNSCHTAKGTAPKGESAPPGRICVDANDPNCSP